MDLQAAEVKPAEVISKKKRKLLVKQKKEREKRGLRGEVLSQLKSTQLSQKHLGVMESSSSLGQKETHRQRLLKQIQRQEAGLNDLASEIDVGPARPYQEQLPLGRGGVLTAGATGGAGAPTIEEEPDPSSYLPNARHWMAGPLKKKDGDHYRQGFNKNTAEKQAKNATAATNAGVFGAPQASSAMAGVPFGKLAEQQPLHRTDLGISAATSEALYNDDANVKPETVNNPTEEDDAADDDTESDGDQADMQDDDEAAPVQTMPEIKPFNVSIKRPVAVQKSRQNLPVIQEEQLIMETIMDNDVCIVAGETGSGKTTQIPQFLYEAGFGAKAGGRPGMIGVTQPRRVAAVSTATRVATELGLTFGKEVAYQVRYEANVGKHTKVKFMTDGILLKEIQQDFLLAKYSVIIIDEAHERSINTDVLIGLLSRVVDVRKQHFRDRVPGAPSPLKLVIMSATLRTADFTQNRALFPSPPPVVSVPGRTFEVVIHHAKKTELDDYVSEVCKKVSKIHTSLPPGGILIFLPGKQEIATVVRRLRKRFPTVNEDGEPEEEMQDEEEDAAPFSRDDFALDIDDAESSQESGDEGVTADEGEEDGEKERRREPLHVLPLFSMLSTAAQLRVFDKVPEGHRLVIVATNIAETSLTIPGIKYVVDTGRQKARNYDLRTGVSKFEVEWISQASANQRAGRAGRTEKGHCYRLYSSAVFNDQFEQYAKPEVERLPMDGMCLSMKSMGIDDLSTFPFPSPPEPAALMKATKHLASLGAITTKGEKITDLGYSLSLLPVAPRYAKMLVLGHQGGCLPYVVALVAMMAVGDPVMPPIKDEQQFAPGEKRLKKSQWQHPTSNLLGGLKAVGAYEWSGAAEKFCNDNGLHSKTMKEIHDLRLQLVRIINTLEIEGKSPNLSNDWNLDPPTANQEKLLQQVIIAGFIDQVARRIPHETVMQQPELQRGYVGCANSIPCWIHPHSSVGVHSLPEYVVYQEIVIGKRATMRGVTLVPADNLYRLGNTLCTFSAPMEDPPPWYDADKDSLMCFATPRFGEHAWDLPVAAVPMPDDYKDKSRIFARLFLEGNVCHVLKQFLPALKMKPSSVMGKVAQPRVVSLLRAIAERSIDSLPALHREWTREPQFLLEIYLLWVNQSSHAEIRKMWPPMQKNPMKRKKKA